MESLRNNSNNERSKKEYFSRLALTRVPEMRLLLSEGKLFKRDGWRNVVEHSIVQVAAATMLAKHLQLNENDSRALTKVAACHDWAKRIEKQPQDFTPEEIASAQEYLRVLSPDPLLMSATSVEWFERAASGRATFLERLTNFIDVTTMQNSFVSPQERIKEARPRWPDQTEEYWQTVIQVTQNTAANLYSQLRAHGVSENDLPNADAIPEFLKNSIERKYTSTGS